MSMPASHSIHAQVRYVARIMDVGTRHVKPSRRPLHSLPASFWRGGTSNAVIFEEKDLPTERSSWAPIFRSVMGSPDPNGRQLDGMGGGISSLSKICVVKKSLRDDADVDYTFAQIGIKDDFIGYSINCGNMSSAIGPFAVDRDILSVREAAQEMTVRIYNTNTKKIIHNTFPLLPDGTPDFDGDLAIDGVAGTASRIKVSFISPGGARTGKLLPTSRAIDIVHGVPGLGDIPISLVDCANPVVFVRASDLGVEAGILPDQIASNHKLMQQLMSIREKGAVLMGIATTEDEARKDRSAPYIAFVGPSAPHMLLSGEKIEDGSTADFLARVISSGDPHRALPVTVGICMAAAASIPGTLVQDVMPRQSERADPEGITIAHPTGKLVVGAEVQNKDGQLVVNSGTLYRTARKLFEGQVFYRL